MQRLALALVLAAAPALAQTPDPTPAETYWPLAVGNEWHTSRSWNPGWAGGQSTTQTLTRIVAEDPAVQGGFLTEWERRVSSQMGTETTTGTGTLRYDPATQRIDGAETPCPLGAPFDVPSPCSDGRNYQVTGGTGQSVTVGSQTITAPRKQFRHSFSAPGFTTQTTIVYAAGIGEVSSLTSSSSSGSYTHGERTLRFARIGGVDYGSPIFPVSGEESPEVGAPALTVSPNPAARAVVIRLVLASSEASARVVVLDALGREVARLHDGPLATGAHTLPLDTARMAPGLYLVHMDAGGASARARLTVVR